MLRIDPTDKTPLVALDPASGRLEIAGCSIHENSDRFFRPLLDALSAMAQAPPASIEVHVALDYFNSSSSKYLLDVLRMLEDIHVAGRSKVSMAWSHAEEDLDMEEAGRDYKALLDFPVKVFARP
jgi:hypothetical protein